MIKIKNNAGEIIEVTQVAWDVLYKEREGFTICVKEAEKKAEPTSDKKLTPRQKAVAKKVTKDDKSK